MPQEDLSRLAAPVLSLTRELCRYRTGVVTPDNERFFARLSRELSLQVHRYPSGREFNGWLVPRSWQVVRARLEKGGRQVYDAAASPLGVASYSRPFSGELDWEELRRHLVTNPDQPQAHVFHCQWQYRPWQRDWALSLPYSLYERLGPGRYRVEIETREEPGEMLVATCELPGEYPQTIVFNAHSCHPAQANDGMAAVAVLVRLFQWLGERPRRRYTYRLVLGPEHLGTVFYLSELPQEEIGRLVGGIFADMPGVAAPLRIASTFLGDQEMDRVVEAAVRQVGASFQKVPWRQGAGNDETVWEAPGWEVPFVEVTRCRDLLNPYPEYHTDLDSPERLDATALGEFLLVLQAVVEVLEEDVTARRRFQGLVCLSNPKYNLYFERPDPAVAKDLSEDSERWGYLLDCLLRYLDGRWRVRDMALRHGLPFRALRAYLQRFADKGLVDLDFVPIHRQGEREPPGRTRDHAGPS
jgi:aminopeptidase-like protein